MPRQDSEPPMVAASRWVSEITSIALQFCLPVGAGFWLDGRFGTEPWCVLVGAGLGFITAAMSLSQLVKRLSPKPKSTLPKSDPNNQPPTDKPETSE